MKTENDQRRQDLLFKYTSLVLMAYGITQFATLCAHWLGLSSVTYPEIFLVTSVTFGVSLAVLLIIKLKQTFSTRFTKVVFFGQFAVWLLMYTVWVLTLREVRVMALFCGVMALTFLLSSARLTQSIAITVGVTLAQIGGSYLAIFVLKQPGSFVMEVFYTFCFLPSALFICNLSGQYAQQRSELTEAKHTAERQSEALGVEMEKVNNAKGDLERAFNRIEELAIRDELTGLYNRRYLMVALDKAKLRADRTGHLFSLIMLDIDHFKRVNDTYGHPEGDAVLKAVAKAVEQAFRANDFAARYGGEEFVVVLEEVDPAGATICAERLRATVEALIFPEMVENFSVTVSLGYTQYRPKESIAQTIARVDAALYRAKAAGRNRVVFD